MKAITCTKYGPPEVLEIVDIEKPSPKDNEILVKIYATSVTIADSRVRGFIVPSSYWLPSKFALGFFKPRQAILGSELSGVIEEVGKDVTKFNIGDEIFAFSGHKFGAYAEYKCIDENDCIAIKPKNLSFEQSAALSFGGIAALHFLKKGNVRKDENVLIYGASGSVGTYAVQLAKYFGARVIGVCSTKNLELVKSLGADSVIDYTKTDLASLNEKFDVVFDAVGKSNISKTIKLIKPKGRYIHTVITPFTKIKIRLLLLKSDIKLVGGISTPTVESINFISKLAEEGQIKPVIDQIYPFEQIIEAHKYVDLGHKKGNVVITVLKNE